MILTFLEGCVLIIAGVLAITGFKEMWKYYWR